jgi:hypothetical protein
VEGEGLIGVRKLGEVVGQGTVKVVVFQNLMGQKKEEGMWS